MGVKIALTVSVINPIHDTKEQNITVGSTKVGYPADSLSKIYVSNSNNNTVSVIDVSNQSKPYTKELHDLVVGQSPGPMAFNPQTLMIYVANTGSGTVSVINGYSSKVAADVRFNVNPGRIMCDNQSGTNQIEYPTNAM